MKLLFRCKVINAEKLMFYYLKLISHLELLRPSLDLNLLYKEYASKLLETRDEMDRDMALAILERANKRFPLDVDLNNMRMKLLEEDKQE